MEQVKIGDKNIQMKRVTDLVIGDALITQERHPITITEIMDCGGEWLCFLETGVCVPFRVDRWVRALRPVAAQQAFAAEAEAGPQSAQGTAVSENKNRPG